MSTASKAMRNGAMAALVAIIAALAMAPTLLQAADHLDAPGLASPGGDPRFDINDLYVFEGQRSSNTVLAMTVSPAATGESSFLSYQNGAYFFRVDSDGDAVEDRKYSVKFWDGPGNAQFVLVRKATGQSAQSDSPTGRLIGFGKAGDTIRLRGGGKLFTGLRSDPFFFDLGGFLGSVEGANNGRMFNDGNENDFFAELNSLAIVLEVRDKELGSNIGVWSTTSERRGAQNWAQVDRMGRPAINTVVNSSGPLVNADSNAKNVFNESKPRNDVANFTGAVVDALQVYSSLDSEGPYSDDEAAGLAGVLLPDVITYDTGTRAVGPFNGRALADDVIDIELRIVTGGDPLDLFPRDADGGINTDGVGPHDDYLSRFPYLGEPNQ